MRTGMATGTNQHGGARAHGVRRSTDVMNGQGGPSVGAAGPKDLSHKVGRTQLQFTEPMAQSDEVTRGKG